MTQQRWDDRALFHRFEESMSQKLYVGNLPFSMTEDSLRSLFSEYGEVDSVTLITDRETGRPRGFGFVEMSSGAEEAIQNLNNHDVEGRALKVNEAKPRESGGSRGGRW
jgi:RNA recognition motif-containing protein